MKQQLALLLVVLLGTVCVLSAATTAQEQEDQQHENRIILLNQDGDEVLQEGHGIEMKGRDAAGLGTKLKKIIVLGPDGKKRELDASNAESIVLNQSVKSVVENGEKQTRVQGKVVVIGPDGKRTEFDLAEPLEMGAGARMLMVPGGLGRLEQMIGGLPLNAKLQKLFVEGKAGLMPGRLQITRGNVGKYMVGVHCNPVTPALRHHLDLSDDVGLIVDAVTENSPAANAGIQQYDILLYANQAALSSVDDLVNAVNKAGDEGLPLSLNLLRKGKEVAVEVEPIDRPATQAGAPLGFDGVQWNQMGPGIIMAGDTGLDGFEQQMKQMEKQMRVLKAMHLKVLQDLQDQEPGNRLDNSDQ